MRIGIVIDDWKLGVFREILTDEGYKFEQSDGVTKDTRSLFVETDDPVGLKRVVEKCQRKSAELKG
jgi:hypothetical protein